VSRRIVKSNHHLNGFQRVSRPRAVGNVRLWAKLPDEELLKWRMCDLGLKIENSAIADRIERLKEELELRGLRFRPHFWLSDEWFSPDGVPGVAIPFYLAHPRLARLERKKLLEVEGGSEEWCMRILRHEVGHALDTAYRLHTRRRYRELFGRYADPYPEYYSPKPSSKDFVLHLEPCYAQAHPAEDFAETFAVWLKPRSTWRTTYVDWPVIEKLEYVAELMEEIRSKPALVTTREQVEPLRTIKKTLGEHYAQKREYYGMDLPSTYDRQLRRVFSDAPDHARQPTAAAFLRLHRVDLRKRVAQLAGDYPHTIEHVLREITQRCRELDLRLVHSPRETMRMALRLVTAQTKNYLQGGHHRVAL